jgi:hypothetical protein
MKTSGFRGRCASVIASLRSSRLFIHSLLGVTREPRQRRRPAGHARFAPATPSSITNVAFVSSGDPRRSTNGVVRKWLVQARGVTSQET